MPKRDVYTFLDSSGDESLLGTIESTRDKKRSRSFASSQRKADVQQVQDKKKRKSIVFEDDNAVSEVEEEVSDVGAEEAELDLDTKEGSAHSSQQSAQFTVPTGFTFLPMCSAVESPSESSEGDEG